MRRFFRRPPKRVKMGDTICITHGGMPIAHVQFVSMTTMFKGETRVEFSDRNLKRRER